MRRLIGAIGLAVIVGGLSPVTAPAVPATVVVRCAQISPNDTPATCTYKATVFEHEVLTAFTLGSYTIDWFDHGAHLHYACTAGSCRIQPGRSFNADAGTTIRITVTHGIVVVRQVVVAGVPL